MSRVAYAATKCATSDDLPAPGRPQVTAMHNKGIGQKILVNANLKKYMKNFDLRVAVFKAIVFTLLGQGFSFFEVYFALFGGG